MNKLTVSFTGNKRKIVITVDNISYIIYNTPYDLLAESKISSFIPIKSSKKLYKFPWKKWSSFIMSSHDVYNCQATPQTLWRWDVTHLKITKFTAEAKSQNKKWKKLGNDGRTWPTSLRWLTSVEAVVSWGRLVMQMGNAAPRDADRPKC